MFKHILTGIQLGPENSKTTQQQKIHNAVDKILTEAYEKQQLQDGIPVTTYSEMVSSLFIASLLIWANQSNYSLTERMERTLDFIHHSIFKI